MLVLWDQDRFNTRFTMSADDLRNCRFIDPQRLSRKPADLRRRRLENVERISRGSNTSRRNVEAFQVFPETHFGTGPPCRATE